MVKRKPTPPPPPPALPAELMRMWDRSNAATPAASPTPTVGPHARIADFVLRCRGSRRAIAALVKAELTYLRAEYALATLPTMLTHYRRALAISRKDHPAIPSLCINDAENRLLRARARAHVVRAQHSPQEVATPLAMLTTARNLVATPGTAGTSQGSRERWQPLLVGLLLLTGRRPIELLHTGKFRSVPGQPFRAMFCGQAKTRKAAGTRTGWYEIPLLDRYGSIADGVARLRAALPPHGVSTAPTTGLSIHNRFAKTTYTFAGTVFPGRKPYDLRAIYALMCHTLFAPDHVLQAPYYAEILGHKLLVPEADTPEDRKSAGMADTQTAAFYLRYYLSEKTRRTLKRARSRYSR